MITTFYSYKGGVGRSMALANVADVFARRGLRTAMIDFDLEAPGIERFFLSDPTSVRRNPGLLDLLLAYKEAMSAQPGEDEAAFRKLEMFLVPIYRLLPSGGRLDLLPAGRRGDDEQLATYAYHLRTFDWQEFYFEWMGEVFFQWLRRELLKRYDVVLVDSRTGMTEMGGICAYQLADQVVMFCAANSQNVQGTRDVIRNFQSPRVLALRKERPLNVVVVPARVQQNSKDVERFRSEFDKSFMMFTPPALATTGRTMWDLMLPYEAAYAFEERLLSADTESPDLKGAFARLADTIALLAPVESRLSELLQLDSFKTPVEPEFDPTRQFAGFDVFLSYNRADEEAARALGSVLRSRGLKVWLDLWEVKPGEELLPAIERGLDQSRAFVVLIGPSEPGLWRKTEERLILERSISARDDFRLIPVLLPGSTADSVPSLLRTYTMVDLRTSLRDEDALYALTAAIRGDAPRLKRAPQKEVKPYKGLEPFREDDASLFFGREREVADITNLIRTHGFVALVGPSGSGKSSLVQAGIIPRLRSEFAGLRVVLTRPGARPIGNLAAALADVTPYDASELERRFAGYSGQISELFQVFEMPLLIVVDQLEEIWQQRLSRDERKAFVRTIRAAAILCKVIVVLRADFLSAALEGGFHDLLSAGLVMLTHPSRETLRQVIEAPALLAGLAFEPGLVERLLDDAEAAATPLPLLQVTLQNLWLRQQRGFLTHAGYEETGRLGSALARSADATFDSLPQGQQAAARSLLLRMVTFEGHRRMLLVEELNALEREVLEILARSSLVVIDRARNVTFATLTHDAVVHEWPRLARWLEDSREFVRVAEKIREAAREWDVNGHLRDYLYRGRVLAQAELVAQASPELLGTIEQEFLRASRASDFPSLLRRALRLVGTFVHIADRR